MVNSNQQKILKLINQIEEAIVQLKIEMGLKTIKKVKEFKAPLKAKKLKIKKRGEKHSDLLEKIKTIKLAPDKYPIIKNNDTVLIRCLFILDATKNEAGIKELTAAQIEVVAPYFYKLTVSRQAARQALDAHPELVGIRREGPKRIFYSIEESSIKYYRKKNETVSK